MPKQEKKQPKTLGGKVRELRGDRPQRVIAKGAAISRITLARIEGGVHKRPEVETLDRLAPVLGCDVDELLVYLKTPERKRRKAS